jgi:hypothetical protein
LRALSARYDLWSMRFTNCADAQHRDRDGQVTRKMRSQARSLATYI